MQPKQQKPEITITIGNSKFNTPRYMAHMKGKRGRLSPMFLTYTGLLNWMQDKKYV